MSSHESNLLWMIQGMRGENLATAYLKWLIKTREQSSRRILECLVGKDAFGQQLDPGKLHSIETEMGTVCATETGEERGRIDMTIITDKYVIGVESKFHAPLQDNQPWKYLDSLRERAVKERVDHRLVLLIPKSRKGEIKEKLSVDGSAQQIILITWDELLRVHEDMDDSEIHMLHSFVERCCNPFVFFNIIMEKAGAGGDQEFVRESQFMAALCAFDDAVPSLAVTTPGRSPKNYWNVRYVTLGDVAEKSDDKGMIGFVDADYYSILGARDRRVFVMCLPQGFEIGEPDPALGLIPVSRSDTSRRRGIISHNKLDGQVWTVAPEKLDPNRAKEGLDEFQRRWLVTMETLFDARGCQVDPL